MRNWVRGWVVVVGIVGGTWAVAAEGFVGRVVDASGKAVEGAQVCATPVFAAAGARTRTICGTSGADGSVTLAAVPPGAQQVSVRAPNHASIENARVDWAGTAATPFTWAVSPAGAIAARLTDPSGRGIAGAKVTLQDRMRGNTVQVTTDANGALRVDGLAAGYWRLEIEPAEYRSVIRDNVTVEPGATTDLGALRARAASFVEGQVVDASGAGVPAAEVRVQEAAGSRTVLRMGTTDEQGRFRIGGLPARAAVDLQVHPRKDFAARTFARLTLPVAARAFVVDPTVTLTGRAIADGGTLPNGSRVIAWLHPGHPSFDANAGMAVSAEIDPATGRFTLEGVAAGGDVDVRLYAPGMGEATTTVAVEAGKDAPPIELRPKRTGFVLRGQVVDRSGRPIEGARLGAVVSGPDGRFAIEGLQPGSNRIVVQHPLYAPVVQEFPADGEGETVVVLDAGGAVEGVVTDPRGRPIVGARVAGDAPGLFTTTGVGGRYRLEHVPSGEGGIERQSAGVGGDVDRRKVAVALGASSTVNFRMPPGTLEGSVTRGGEAVSASISVRQSSEPETKGARPDQLVLQSTASDEDGGYRVVALRPGAASVVVTDGKQTLTLPATIGEDGASRLDVEMPRYSLEGVVLDGSGAPVAGACVASGLAPERTGKQHQDDAFARTATDGEGRFLLYTDEEDPKEVTVCTCAQGCHDVSVDAGARGTATLWFAPVGAKQEVEVAPAKR